MAYDSERPQGQHRFVDRLEVAGDQLVRTVRSLVTDASVRRVVVKNATGRTLVDIPLTLGLAGGTAMVILAPFVAALTVVGATIAKVTIEVEREG